MRVLPLTSEKLLSESLMGDFVYYKYMGKGKCAHPANSCRIGYAHPENSCRIGYAHPENSCRIGYAHPENSCRIGYAHP